jgi:rhodanese-related sulfurtransferase
LNKYGIFGKRRSCTIAWREKNRDYSWKYPAIYTSYASKQSLRSFSPSLDKFVILDVREPDEIRDDGAISGHTNIPYGEFQTLENSRRILQQHQDKEQIIVHCFKSQKRGPYCANALIEALETLEGPKPEM